MTGFTILLEKPNLGMQVAAGAIATVRRIRPEDSQGAAWRSQLAVEAGTGIGTLVEVPTPGLYDIELVTPSGQTLTDQQELAAGEVKRLAFGVGGSPHEWLSWQQFSGYVPSAARYESGRLGAQSAIAAISAGTAPEIREVILPRDPTMWARIIGSVERRSAASNTALERTREESRDRYGMLKVDTQPLRSKILTTDDDERILQWLIEPEGPWGSEDDWTRWGFVTVDQVRELVTIPSPWEPGGMVEVSFDRARPHAIAFSTIVVRDQRFGGLLGYLGSGRPSSANLILREGDFDLVQDVLFAKGANPLAAAGAALVAVLAANDTAPQRWDPWLDNLSDWFPWLPDGTVALAYRRLQQASTDAEFDTARNKFVEAFERGVPYYSAALSMLSGGLGQFASEEACIEERYRETVAFCSLVDPHQTFTVVRLSGKRGATSFG